MSKELRPCPFCGEKATLDYSVLPNRKHWFITCDCCGMMYQYTLSQRKYVKDGWNTRPIEDALRARIAELEEQVWIPVGERLPEVYRDGDGEFIPFLVCENDKDYPYRAIYDGLNWGDGMFVADVTHWMPLPEPPIVYGKVCIDQLTAHDATERQDDKSPNDTQPSTIVCGKESEE